VVSVVLLCLLCGSAVGTLKEATDALDILDEPIDLVYRNLESEYLQVADSINTIFNNLYTVWKNLNGLGEDDFNTFCEHTTPDSHLDAFNLIVKLLYTQSARTRTEFTTPGGPHIRMYSFAILGTIASKFGALDNEDGNNERKQYFIDHLTPTARPPFYTSVDTQLAKELGQEEGNLDDEPVDWEGPFVDAIETLEGQLYNFYMQWARKSPRFAAMRKKEKLETMNAVLHNMFVVLDFIMNADDYFTDPLEGQGETLANYIFFFENNRVIDIISQVADVESVVKEVSDLSTYAKFLLYTYFIDDVDNPPPAASTVVGRLVVTTYKLGSHAIFSPFKQTK